MPTLNTKLGDYELPQVHMWKDRKVDIRAERTPIISRDSRIATIGSCFAQELANAITRLGLRGAMHPTGLFYTTRSIRQEVERVFGGWKAYADEPHWQVGAGFVHPFKNYKKAFGTIEALSEWSDKLDRQAEELFKSADVIAITLGLIEAWVQPKNGNHYRNIPHPEVFDNLGVQFHRLTVAEMVEDLTAIREVLRRNTKAEIIITVSPVPLLATMSKYDVRVANAESKSRIRAAVSEFIDANPDVHYFHSYEIVTTAERQSDFMKEDGRHVHPYSVDYILQQFLRTYASDEVDIPTLDLSWLSAPTKTAARVKPTPPTFQKRIKSAFAKLVQSS